MAIRWDITDADEVFVGEDHDIETTIYEPGTTRRDIESGLAVVENITGWTFEWVVRQEPRDVDQIARYATGDVTYPITVVNALAGGPLRWTLLRALTLPLPPGVYSHTLRRTNAGVSKMLTYGSLTLKQPTTR